jgi:hypothetical protein
MNMEFRTLALRPDPRCPACGSGTTPLDLPADACITRVS